nr:hypothetical protein BaRGS_029784 [Batillaria attramentaria]
MASDGSLENIVAGGKRRVHAKLCGPRVSRRAIIHHTTRRGGAGLQTPPTARPPDHTTSFEPNSNGHQEGLIDRLVGAASGNDKAMMEEWPSSVMTATPPGPDGIYYMDGGPEDNQSWSSDGNISNPAATLQKLYEDLLAHPNIRMRDELLRYLTPVLIVFGNFSNLLALIVLRRKNLRQQSVCFYMAAYAVANILVLDLILGIQWFCFVLEKTYIAMLTDSLCRLWTFATNVIIYCGIWFVVMMSIDRFIYLCYAHKATSYCTVFAAKAIVVIVMIGLIVVSIHAMWIFELQPQGCFVSYEQQDLHTMIWPWWSATIYSYLPLALLFLINITLSVSLCLKRHRQRRSQQVGEGDDFAITTLVISSCFWLLTVPATAINVIDIHYPSAWLSIDLIAEIELTKKITEILSHVNQTLLGVILMIFSRAFRQEVFSLVQAVRFKRRPKVYEMGNMNEDSRGHREIAKKKTQINIRRFH